MDVEAGTDVCNGDLLFQGGATKGAVIILPSDRIYSFAVAAVTGAGTGPFSPAYETSSKIALRPVPRVAVGTASFPSISVIDTDMNQTESYSQASKLTGITYMGSDHTIIALNVEGQVTRFSLETKKATLYFNIGNKVDKVALDWAGRYLYWSRDNSIWKADLQVVQPMEQLVLKHQHPIRDFKYHQLGNLYFTTFDGDNSKIWLTELNARGSAVNTTKIQEYSGPNPHCDCNIFQNIDTFAILEQPSQFGLAIRDSDTGDIVLTDKSFCHCQKVATSHVNDAITIEADLTSVYILSQMEKKVTVVDVHLLTSSSISLTARNVSGSTCITPVCPDCQSNVELLQCLQIQRFPQVVDIVHIEETSAKLKLPFPSGNGNEECINVPLPSTSYNIYYSLAAARDPSCYNESSCFKSTFKTVSYYNEGNLGDRMVTIDGLLPFTRYAIQVEVTNLYSTPVKNDTLQVYSFFQTEEGAPSTPREVEVEVISPERIALTWMQPAVIQSSIVSYEVHWQSEDFSHGVRKNVANLTVTSNTQTINYTITGLGPDQLYNIWVVAMSGGGKSTDNSTSHKQKVRTFKNPPAISVIGTGPRELNFTWAVEEHSSILEHKFLVYPKAERNASWQLSMEDLMNSETSNFYSYNIKHLSPGICYIIKVAVKYHSEGPFYEWPEHDTLCHITLPPGTPIISVTSQNSQVTVTWKENDEDVEAYELQMKLIGGGDGTDYSWTSLDENIQTNHFIFAGGYSGNYSFRVRARNHFDWGNFSSASIPQDIDRMIQAQHLYAHSGQVTIGAVCAGIIGFILIVCASFCLLTKNQSFVIKKKKSLLGGLVMKQTDRELEDLREFPIRHGFIDANNPMYQVELPTDEELALIPKIKRSQITLTKFLGSGAFGEVFEGLVKEFGEDGLEVKIAVKTLRKGATESEKAEFLKEAKLMWNFKHEHILNLNAICLDNDPNFLILELMEGGDLLSYLRQNRPKGLNQNVSLFDLVQMCLDVAKGKAFLLALIQYSIITLLSKHFGCKFHKYDLILVQ